jgi:hypothetical protein
LDQTKVSYFVESTDSYPRGEIDIEFDTKIMERHLSGREFSFAIITPKRVLYCCADTAEELVTWIYHLRASVYYINLKRVFEDPQNFLHGHVEGSLEKRGFLKKQGGHFMSMKERYFLLRDGKLIYRERADKEVIDTIDLKGAKIEERTNKTMKEYGMVLHTDKRQFFFMADTPGDQKEWIDSIHRVCMSLSSASLVESHSNAIHEVIFSKMIHGTDRVDGAVSPHSPFMFRSESFHRSWC